MNNNHKIGLRRPGRQTLGLRLALGDADRGQHRAERILREQFWLPTSGRVGSRLQHFPASGADSASCAAPSKKRERLLSQGEHDGTS